MTVLEVRSPAVLLSDLFRDLFARAFADPAHADAQAAQVWLAERLLDPSLGVWVATRQGLLAGLLVVSAATIPFSPQPWAVHLYAEAPGVKAALARRGVAWLREKGHTHFWAIRAGDLSDERWEALFQEVGKIRRIGTLFEFTIEG